MVNRLMSFTHVYGLVDGGVTWIYLYVILNQAWYPPRIINQLLWLTYATQNSLSKFATLRNQHHFN